MEFKPTELILRSRAKHCVSKDGTILLVAVLRDARKSALLRTRLIDDIKGIRTSNTMLSQFSIEVELYARSADERP
jgi:hypothetical protein